MSYDTSDNILPSSTQHPSQEHNDNSEHLKSLNSLHVNPKHGLLHAGNAGGGGKDGGGADGGKEGDSFTQQSRHGDTPPLPDLQPKKSFSKSRHVLKSFQASHVLK